MRKRKEIEVKIETWNKTENKRKNGGRECQKIRRIKDMKATIRRTKEEQKRKN